MIFVVVYLVCLERHVIEELPRMVFSLCMLREWMCIHSCLRMFSLNSFLHAERIHVCTFYCITSQHVRKQKKAIHWMLSQTFTSPVNCLCCWLGFKERKLFLRKLSSAKRTCSLDLCNGSCSFCVSSNSSSLLTDLGAAACLLHCARTASHPAAGDPGTSWLASLCKHPTYDSLKEFWTICCIGALVKPAIGMLWGLFRSSIATIQRDFWGTKTDNWV